MMSQSATIILYHSTHPPPAVRMMLLWLRKSEMAARLLLPQRGYLPSKSSGFWMLEPRQPPLLLRSSPSGAACFSITPCSSPSRCFHAHLCVSSPHWSIFNTSVTIVRYSSFSVSPANSLSTLTQTCLICKMQSLHLSF